MNININTASNQGIEAARLASGNADFQPAAELQAGSPRSDISITNAAVNPEELEAALLPASTLLRDDALGKLFTQAFNLPPPPMPAFPAD